MTDTTQQPRTVLDEAASMANMVWADVGETDAATLCSNVLRSLGIEAGMTAARLREDLAIAQRARSMPQRLKGIGAPVDGERVLQFILGAAGRSVSGGET